MTDLFPQVRDHNREAHLQNIASELQLIIRTSEEKYSDFLRRNAGSMVLTLNLAIKQHLATASSAVATLSLEHFKMIMSTMCTMVLDTYQIANTMIYSVNSSPRRGKWRTSKPVYFTQFERDTWAKSSYIGLKKSVVWENIDINTNNFCIRDLRF